MTGIDGRDRGVCRFYKRPRFAPHPAFESAKQPDFAYISSTFIRESVAFLTGTIRGRLYCSHLFLFPLNDS